MAEVSKQELLHIAQLADLNLREEEVDTYLEHLKDTLNFAEIVNNAPTEGLEETIGQGDAYNVFRKDEIQACCDRDTLLQNAPEQERGMFKIPKVI